MVWKKGLNLFLLLCMTVSFLSGNVSAQQEITAVSKTADEGEEGVNLAYGKQVAISQPDAVFDQIQGIGLYGSESPLNQAWKLTDGKYGDVTNWANTADWFVFYRKLKREVVIDLEQVSTINKISTGFGMRGDVGIAPPINVRFYVSNDGSDYRYLGKSEPDTPFYFEYTNGSNDMHRKVYAIDRTVDGQPLNVQGRFVKLVFTINIFGWMDEIEVIGKPGVVDGAELPPQRDDGFTYDQYAAPGAASSAEIRDQFLWYSGPMSASNSHFTDWTKEKASAFLAYKDIYGRIRDWFFSDILAIPVTQMITPSGFDQAGNARYVTKEDLLAYLDFIFQEDTQLGAIDQAASEINRALRTNQKVRVNMAIPFIEESSNFGDIYNDGSTLPLRAIDFADQVDDPSSYEGRLEMARLAFENKKAAVRWYIEEVERRFQEAGYRNLVLNSFYWYHERIMEPTGEAELIQATSQYLKDKGYYFTWIPYIGPGSAYLWRDLGFTTASVQPNFAFSNSKKAIFPAISDLARRTGGALEIEYDDYRTLSQYLNYGVFEGYMTGAHNTYYLAAMPIVDGAYAFTPLDPTKVPDSLSAIRRGVYDQIYNYVKGQYEPTFGMHQSVDLSDPADLKVTVKLPLADHVVEGEFTLHYDQDHVTFSRFSLPAALQGKGTFQVDDSRKGRLKVSFRIDHPDHAIFADLLERRNPLAGAPDLITLHFVKRDARDDAALTSRMFAIDDSAVMKGKNGTVYRLWSDSDIIPGSPEDQLVSAFLAVKKAEETKMRADITYARVLVARLPHSPVRSELTDRLNELNRNHQS